MKIAAKALTALCVVATTASVTFAQTTLPTPEAYKQIAAQVQAVLQKDILDKWFPTADDEQNGGFFENYREDWTRGTTGQKSIVYQSRLTWLSAGAAMRYPDRATEYLAQTRRGAAVLAEKLWDKERGGFFWQVDDSGKPSRSRPNEKHVYGNAFGIYALATSYQATHDQASLDLAKKAFTWLDQHAHDGTNGGYFEALTLDGKPIDATTRGNDAIGTAFGRKSMNTHIHLLEALTTLYAVWPDATVRARLSEIYEIGLTKIYSEPGYLRLFFGADWTPIPTRDSFGHDIETAFLLAEAAAALGKPDDSRAWAAGRKMVDHALEIGYDKDHGGFYNEGALAGDNLAKEKIWWVQAEGLNALLLMHEKFGKETPRYWMTFLQQWNFIAKYQIDSTHGGWYSTVRPDGASIPNRPKSDMWTEGYHQGRAMLSVSEMLLKLAEEK